MMCAMEATTPVIRVVKMRSCRLSGQIVNKINGNALSARYTTDAAACSAISERKSFEEIPGLPSLPIIGQMHHFLPYIGVFGGLKSSYEMMDGIYKKYGPLVRMNGILKKPPIVFTFDPEDMEYILRRENTMPIRSGFDILEHFRKEVKVEEYDGNFGLLVDHGEGWKKFRSTVNPVMLQPRTIKLYAGQIDQVAQDMVERLKRIRNTENKIEGLEIEMNKWALESIALVGLGGRVGCLEDELPDDSPARQIIKSVRDIFEIMDELDFKPSIWRWYATPTYKRAIAAFEKQEKLSEMFINKAIEEMKSRPPIAHEDKSILEKLLEINRKIALVMASDMLFAGVDTAAHTMLALLYNLATNPEKQDKLRQEIRAGNEKKYLKACTKENNRLMPVVSGNIRRLNQDLIMKGYLLPKGIDVIFTHEYMSRHESQYLRAKEYLPERWLVSKEDPLHYGHAHPMTTMPFGHGVRSCIGRRIAELEVETFITRLIESFELKWEGPPPNVLTKGLNYMQPLFNFTFNDAK